MQIEFTNPLALLLLALAPVALYLSRNSLANLSRARARASLGARLLILLLVVLALAGLRIKLESRDIALIFLVDVSASVAPAEQQKAIGLINGEIERAGARDFIGVIAFGREASVELAPTRKELLGDYRLTEINSNPPKDYTDVAAAFRLATALVPEAAAGRFVLISDGNENLESAVEEARLLKAEGIEVHTRAIATASTDAARQGEVSLRELSAPEMTAEGEAFDLKAAIDSTRDTTGVLRIFRNDSLVAERQVELTGSGENVFVLPQRNEQKGFYTYRAEVESIQQDGFVQNNSREAFTMVEGRPKTLYLYGDAQPSPGIARVLAEGSFAADIRSAANVPTRLAGFQDYDLVIFDNVPATMLTTAQMKMVQSYVKDLGGGFLMIGGDQSFGPGGYYKTPIEETLPVSLDVRQKKHFPSLGLVIVMDRSGSMMGEKMQLAIEAASATVDFLSERDSVGVVAFDSGAEGVVNLTRVEDKRAITQKVKNIQVGGGTNIYPGLLMATEQLISSDAQIKHIILLTDGQSEDGDYAGVTQRMREANITLSSVAVGTDADEGVLEMLAEMGGGRFYVAQSAESLPRIFTREAFLASRETIIEEPFVPKLVRPTQATSGLDWTSAPQLGGYVGTAERDSLQSPAITSLVSDKDDPVYAVWQYGLGRSAAFTSDAKARWASGWMNWSGFGQFWTQVFRDTLRRQGASDLSPRVEIAAGRGHVTVEAVTPDGRFKNNLRLRAHVVAPDFSASDIRLEQTAAGRYEADFPAVERGAYLVSVSEDGGETAPVTGAVNSYSPEFGIAATDADLLSRISEATGGSAASVDADAAPLANLFERRATKTRPVEIWEAVLLAALLILPFDVGVRRLNIGREQIQEAREWIASRLRPAVALEPVAETAPAMLKLKASRTRVRLGGGTMIDATEKASPQPVIQQAAPRREPFIRGATKEPLAKEPLAKEAMAKESPVKEPVAPKPAPDNSPVAVDREASPLASRLLNARRKRQD